MRNFKALFYKPKYYCVENQIIQDGGYKRENESRFPILFSRQQNT